MVTLRQQTEPFFAKDLTAQAQLVLLTEDPAVLAAFPQGRSVVEWLTQLTVAEGRRLLSRFQGRALWQTIIDENRARFPVADPAAVALDLEAYHEALLQGRQTRGRAGRESALTQWHKEYKLRLKDLRADDFVGRLSRVASGQHPLLDMTGQVLVLAALDPPTPLWLAVVAQLEEAGCRVVWSQPQLEKVASLELLRVENREQAFWAAGEWARRLLDSGEQQLQLVTESDSDTPRWRQVLGESLGQDQFELLHDRQPQRFPLLTSALELAALDAARVEFASWSRVLRSPFVGDWACEAFGRCELETKLRRAGHYQPPLVKLQRLCRRYKAHSLLPLLMGLQHKALGERTSCALWSQRFREILALASWPGDKVELNEAEISAQSVVEKSLQELASLGRLLGNISHRTALRFWGQAMSGLTTELLDSSRPVQTVGPELGLWSRRANSLCLPSRSSESRFEHLLPGASRTRLQKLRKHRSQQQCWRTLVQLESSDELEELAGIADRETLHLPERSLQLLGAELESWHDQSSPISHQEPVRGGAGLLAKQASCPFRAYADLRLRARPLETVGVGLDARQRGNLVHEVLEKFWTEVKEQSTLLAMDPEQLLELMHRVITEVVANAVHEHSDELDGRGYELERRRLLRALQGALTVERERPPFSVLKTEESVEYELAQATLRLRIDRIDRQDDGGLLLIDYKTGRPSIQEWFSSRPDAPQLPLYLLALGESVEGLGYFRVRPGEENYIGLTSSPFSKMRKLDASRWEKYRQEWREVLSSLMHSFLAGESKVDPKRYPGSCRHCGLSTLCRVSELKR